MRDLSERRDPVVHSVGNIEVIPRLSELSQIRPFRNSEPTRRGLVDRLDGPRGYPPQSADAGSMVIPMAHASGSKEAGEQP